VSWSQSIEARAAGHAHTVVRPAVVAVQIAFHLGEQVAMIMKVAGGDLA
jgi:hypothetical protein